jgi:hypothetical protein
MEASQPILRSTAKLAARVGESGPPFISMKRAIFYAIQAPEFRTYRQTITTPSGTALGGWAELTIKGDGTYSYTLHMEDTGLADYAFSTVMFLRSPRFWFTLGKLGKVSGKFSSGARVYHETERGYDYEIREGWPGIRDSATYEVHKEYESTGVLGDVISLGEAFVGFLAVSAVAGPQVGAIAFLGAELTTDSPIGVSPGTFAGVAIAGGTILLFGPGMLVWAVAAGAVVGTQGFNYRHLLDSELPLVRAVFGNSLDAYLDRIYLTDLHNPDLSDPDRGETLALPGDVIFVNLGDRFTNPVADSEKQKVLIHELVHAWQALYGMFEPKKMWNFVVNPVEGDDAYTYKNEDLFGPAAADPWSRMNIEAQASAVADWFSHYQWFPSPDDPYGVRGLSDQLALRDFRYGYVADHIRMAVG